MCHQETIHHSLYIRLFPVTAKCSSYHKVQWGTYRIRRVYVPWIFGSCFFHFQKKVVSCRADRVGSQYLKYNTKSCVGQNFLNIPSLGRVYDNIWSCVVTFSYMPQQIDKAPVGPIILSFKYHKAAYATGCTTGCIVYTGFKVSTLTPWLWLDKTTALVLYGIKSRAV